MHTGESSLTGNPASLTPSVIRSRQSLWRKGESSGQVQELVEMRLDCDGDTLLLLVDQTGVACHTGRRNCFFRAVRDGELVTIADVEIDPDELYKS